MSVTESILEGISKLLGKVFGTANERELRRLWPIVEEVNARWREVRQLDDAALCAKTAEFRRRLLQGESEDDILPEAFAVCREASHRTHGNRQMVRGKYERITYRAGRFEYLPEEGELPYFAHFDVQIIGGIVLHHGKIAEMVTGEGKTLVATLPCYLNALRPNDEWAALAKQLQGEDMSRWVFRPYVQLDHPDAPAAEPAWELAPHLLPTAEDLTWRRPRRIVPVSRGVHVVTVNDYLAQRDADYNRALFGFLGLDVGAIQSPMDSEDRIPVYMCDITYGTNNEFGFDYLRDNLKVTPESQVQRSRVYAIVDEVDSVLIDEARTPLIISGSTQESSDKYFAADNVARHLKAVDSNALDVLIEKQMRSGLQREQARLAAEEESGADYVYSERDHSVKLTERGIQQTLKILGTEDIYSGSNMDMPHYIDNALKAHSLYKRDTHYIVSDDGKVYIVDEFTGRVLEGRRWSDGLHQAVEAKEGLKIKEESQTIASITFQNFFKLYRKLAGMTGTALTEAKEFMSIYKLGVVSIPTNRRLRRINFPDLIYGTVPEKYTAIADHVLETHKTGQPVLIGTVSIEHSEVIAHSLKVRGIPHEVLNAKHHAREAEIVSKAGQLGQVTVATNMAGRGTDIKLGSFTREELLAHWQRWGLAPKGINPAQSDEALYPQLLPHWVEHYLGKGSEYPTKQPQEWEALLREEWNALGIHGPALGEAVPVLGGLHIVGSERHEARRIDNQLRGRSGRQGDPGSSRFFLSLEDDTMRLFAPERARQFMQWAGLKNGEAIESKLVSRTIEKSQRKVEERNFEARKHVLEYDGVMNDQRTVIYSRRQAWLEGRELRESMLGFCEDHLLTRLQDYVNNLETWDSSFIIDFMKEDFLTVVTAQEIEAARNQPDGDKKLQDFLCEKFRAAYAEKEARIGSDTMRLLEKLLLLETIDRKWMDHLYAMDLLKEGIHLRGYAGQDPKIRYKVEGYELFREMWASLQADVATLVMKITPVEEMRVEQQVEIGETIHSDFNALATEADAKGANVGEAAAAPQPFQNMVPKVGNNEPCPCGSGKKYKKCCGRG